MIQKASEMSIEQISAEVKNLAGACREGTISPDNLTGGSFTLDQLGNVGSGEFYSSAQCSGSCNSWSGRDRALKPKRT